MSSDNHLQNAGQSIAKGVRNATNAASEGRVLDAAESAWEGTATAAREVGKSVGKAAGQVLDATRRNQS